MPRKSKAQATIKPASSPTEAYGTGVQAIQAMKAIPIPDQATRLEGALGAAARQNPGAAAPNQPVQAQPVQLDQATQAAQMMPAYPSAIEEQTPHAGPITTGLSTGPGPNTLSMNQRQDADLFVTMYQITGDPDMLLLAQRTRQAQQGL